MELWLKEILNGISPEDVEEMYLDFYQIQDYNASPLRQFNDNQYFPSLKVLSLSHHQIQQFPNLAHNNLEVLDLSYNSISSFENSYCNTLKSLDLSFNELESLSGLENFPQLRTLMLNHNQIKSLLNLQELKELRTLGLSENPVKNLAKLNYLPKLEQLYIKKIRSNDWSWLANMPNLKELYCSVYEIPQSLHLLTNLEILHIHGAGNISQIEILQFPPKLRDLTLLGFLDLQTVEFPNSETLQSLRVNTTKMRHFQIRSDFPNLQILNLAHNQIHDISDITIFPTLKEIHLFGNPIDLQRIRIFQEKYPTIQFFF